MSNSQVGAAQPVTDSVKRAMEFLKDRPMPRPKAETHRNYRQGRPPGKGAERSPAPAPSHEITNDNSEQRSDQGE